MGEFLSTLGLVLIGCGAIAWNEQTGRLGILGISLAFGLAVAGMVLLFGSVSGAHMNPAMTVGLWLAGRFEKQAVALYVLAQLLGAAAAAAFLRLLFGDGSPLGVTLPSGGVWIAFGAELLMTGTLVFAVLLEKGGKRAVAVLAGVVVAIEAFFGGPVSGASMNPARSFGPALVAGRWDHHWIYWLAPIAGAVLAVWVYKVAQKPRAPAGLVIESSGSSHDA